MKGLLIIFLLFPLFSLAQLITWDKTYDFNEDDYGGGIVQAYDGGYIMTGYTGETEWPNLLVMKLSNNGDTVWTKVYMAEGHSRGNRIIQTNDSCYLISGITCENELYWFYKMFIMKIDQNGDSLWTITHNETNMEGSQIVKTFDGNYVVSGISGWNSFTKSILLKINEDGEIIWGKIYVFEDAISPDDRIALCEQTADSGFIMTGSKGLMMGNSDIFLMKLDINGDSLWTKLYGEPDLHEYGLYVLPVTAGGYIVSAQRTVSGYNIYDLVIMKIDNNGNFLWEKTYESNTIQGLRQLRNTTENDYIGAGFNGYLNGGSGLYVVYFNNFGDTLWTRIYHQNAHSSAMDIIQTSDQGFLVSGGTSNANGFLRDIRVLKLDKNGLVQTQETKEVASNIQIKNFPNPFLTFTNLEFEITEPGNDAKIKIYNSNGLIIKVFELTDLRPGNNKIQLSTNDLPSGIYYCTLETSSVTVTSKMIKIR